MYTNGIKVTVLAALLTVLGAPPTSATEPGADGTLPPSYLERLQTKGASLTFKRSLMQVAARATVARQIQSMTSLGTGAAADDLRAHIASQMGLVAPSGNFVTKVSGVRKIPVILLKYSETQADPYPASNLQRELFDGPWPTHTLTDFYKDISDNALTVTGTVRNWKKLKNSSDYYAGADYMDSRTGNLEKCYGFCENAHVGEFITNALDSITDVNWGDHDNDGPDGLPNSGDDDGYVDFVVFVQPGMGGECKNGNRNIWSHRGSLSNLTGQEYTTKSKRKGGGFIKVDDYVIVPSLACDGTTMIQIGVFAHEFGHAFGLPDLYDTSANATSAGLGNWCLMAGGAWGGDGHSPQTPVRMSAWALSFLGWIDVNEISIDTLDLAVRDIHTSHAAWQVPVSNSQYYLLTYLTKSGFDQNLPTDGLQVWKVNRKVIDARLPNNRVNADATNRGVQLEEADGSHGLDNAVFRGGPGDLFPGTAKRTTFDATTDPASIGNVALCQIGSGNPAHLRVSVSSNTCGSGQAPLGHAPVASPGKQSAAPSSPSASIDDLINMPDLAKVIVRGRLENTGKSLFDRTRHIVLKDSNGHSIDVRLTSPIESSTPDPTRDLGRPGDLSHVLGQDVLVTGTLHRSVDETNKAPQLEISNVIAAPQ